MGKKWNELKKRIWAKSASGNPKCAFCPNPAADLHHAIISRMKKKPELDVKFNALPVCKHCHEFADGYFTRKRAWEILCEKYGEDKVREWYEGLDLVVKENF